MSEFSVVVFEDGTRGRQAEPILASRDPQIVRLVRNAITSRLQERQPNNREEGPTMPQPTSPDKPALTVAEPGSLPRLRVIEAEASKYLGYSRPWLRLQRMKETGHARKFLSVMAERDNQRDAIERARETIFNQVMAINNKHIHPVADRLLKRMQQTRKLLNIKKMRESADPLTDRKKPPPRQMRRPFRIWSIALKRTARKSWGCSGYHCGMFLRELNAMNNGSAPWISRTSSNPRQRLRSSAGCPGGRGRIER